MAKLIMSLPESFDCSVQKSVNLAWEYAKVAWKSYRQPSPPSDPRLRRECTIDHVTILFVAYSKTKWKELIQEEEGKYRDLVLLADRSIKPKDFKLKAQT